MAKAKTTTLQVQGTAITVLSQATADYISLTDMAKRFGDDSLIYSWMRNRNSVEFLGIWEQIHNPGFNSGEFETFRTQAGLNSFQMHILTASRAARQLTSPEHAPNSVTPA